MRIKDYKTQGKPIKDIRDYYRDDYEMLQDICSCRWSEVLVIGLRRFGKTSLLKRIEGFINKREDYAAFLKKGLKEWDRERDGNPPRKEFFDEMNALNAKSLYLSFLEAHDILEENTTAFFSELAGGRTFERLKLEQIEAYLPPKLFILMDEFSKLAELDPTAEKKRDFFLTFHRSAQNLNKEIVFVIAEPPSIFSTFEMSIKENPAIAEITDALQNRKIFYLNGLSPHEKLNLFCLKKTKNFGETADEGKIRKVLDQLSGIPLEIQIAGEAFFSKPENDASEILTDVAEAFGGNLKSIISTMNLPQLLFIRLVAEAEAERGGLSWDRLKKSSHKLYENLRNFGIVKKSEDELIRFTSEPIRSILCREMEKFSYIVDDETYYRELKTMVISEEEKQIIISPEFEPWDGRIRIHHFSDLSLSKLVAGYEYNEETPKLDLFMLNGGNNPFDAYYRLLKSHSRHIPHILVITGDIALTHHSYCYRGFREFLVEIMSLMKPLPGERFVIPKKQVILVPGEMDISNPTEKDCHDANAKKVFDACNFVDFFRAFNDYGIPPEIASQNNLGNIISIELPSTHGISGFNLEILPFNSATMIWPNQINLRRLQYLERLKGILPSEDQGQIQEEFRQFLGDEIGYLNMDGIEQDAGKNENIDDTLRIAVTHHNLNPHKVRNENYTVDTVNAHEAKTVLLQNRFSVLLHGHQRSPIFIKETLYRKEQKDHSEKKGLKTLFMNGAGKFTETKHQENDNPFGPTFNSYDIRRIANRDGEIGKYKGDFKIHSTVFLYQKEENKFKYDPQVVKEEIFTDED